MSISSRLRLLSSLLFVAAWLVLLDVPFGLAPRALAQYPTGQDVGGEDMIDPGMFGQLPDDGNTPRRSRRPRTKAASKKGRSTKDAADKSEKSKTSAATKPAGAEGSSSGLKFSQDIAPILVANCVGCHKPGGAGLNRGSST